MAGAVTHIHIRRKDRKILFHWGNVYIGYAYIEVDGFYVFSFEGTGGNWSDYALREIADVLTALNFEYDKHLKEQSEKG